MNALCKSENLRFRVFFDKVSSETSSDSGSTTSHDLRNGARRHALSNVVVHRSPTLARQSRERLRPSLALIERQRVVVYGGCSRRIVGGEPDPLHPKTVSNTLLWGDRNGVEKRPRNTGGTWSRTTRKAWAPRFILESRPSWCGETYPQCFGFSTTDRSKHGRIGVDRAEFLRRGVLDRIGPLVLCISIEKPNTPDAWRSRRSSAIGKIE